MSVFHVQWLFKYENWDKPIPHNKQWQMHFLTLWNCKTHLITISPQFSELVHLCSSTFSVTSAIKWHILQNTKVYFRFLYHWHFHVLNIFRDYILVYNYLVNKKWLNQLGWIFLEFKKLLSQSFKLCLDYYILTTCWMAWNINTTLCLLSMYQQHRPSWFK